jgi:hypothetical protein
MQVAGADLFHGRKAAYFFHSFDEKCFQCVQEDAERLLIERVDGGVLEVDAPGQPRLDHRSDSRDVGALRPMAAFCDRHGPTRQFSDLGST